MAAGESKAGRLEGLRLASDKQLRFAAGLADELGFEDVDSALAAVAAAGRTEHPGSHGARLHRVAWSGRRTSGELSVGDATALIQVLLDWRRGMHVTPPPPIVEFIDPPEGTVD